jgi:dipeptidyl aminopeptidase/acylaminoacyl peptidase
MSVFRFLAASFGAAAFILAAPLAAQAPAPARPAASASQPLPAEAAAAPGTARIPIEALAQPALLTSPRLSPDGNRIAARVRVGGRDWIGFWDLRDASGSPPHLLASATDGEVRWLRWAGPNHILLGIQLERSAEGVEFTVSRILSMDVPSGHATALDTGRGILGDDVIFVDPQGAYILVSAQAAVTEYPDVLRVDLQTGGRTTIVERGREAIWDWFVDADGVVRAGVDYSNDRITFYYRSAPGARLRQIDSRRYPQDGSVIDMVRFVGNADRGIVITNAVTGRFGVYDYDFSTGTRGAAIFEHPEADVTSAILGEDGRVDGVTYEDDRQRVHWINPDLQHLQAAIDRALPGKINVVVERSDDRNRLLIWSGAADDPGTYYVFDRAAHRMDAFAQPYEALDGHAFAAVRPIHFRGRDGADIPGYLTLPPGGGERGLPLVLMPHGGPFARDSWDFDPWVQFLASRGYAVLQVNFRGSTGYGRAYVERGFGQFGSGMIDDLEDGVDWLAQQGIADPHRVCIMGASYGGYAALWAPIRHPDRYRCAISFAGVTDVRAILRYDARLFSAPRYSREWRRRIEGEERTDLSLISPLQQAARMTVPVLIAHGEQDRVVPVSQSHNLVRALTRAGTPPESVFYAQEAHGFTKPQDSIDFLGRVEAFLAAHNPATAPPAAAGH